MNNTEENKTEKEQNFRDLRVKFTQTITKI